MRRFLVLLAGIVGVAAASTSLSKRLLKLNEEGLLSNDQLDRLLDADGENHEGSEVATILADLGLLDAAPAFKQHKITTKKELLLLDADTMDRYLHLDLRTILLMKDYIAKEKQGIKQQDTTIGSVGHEHLASIFADMLKAHQEKRIEQSQTVAAVSELIEKNNEQLIARMAAMIEEAKLAPSTSYQHQIAPRRRAQEQQSSGSVLDSASIWVEDDDGAVVFGAAADASLSRPAAGVVAASGGFRVGDLPDNACASADDSGTLRWSVEKGSLQVCDGNKAKWNSAGAATLDAAEGETCNADLKGQLQWDNVNKVLTVCSADTDGSAFLTVFSPPEPSCTGTACTRSVATIGGTKYLILTVKSSGAITASCKITGAEVLLVGGGGSGGGRHGGGGGGGGVLHLTDVTIAAGVHDVVIGAGGQRVFGTNVVGSTGGDTQFLGETAIGGGGGGSHVGTHGTPGGSGGGGGHSNTNGGAATQQGPVSHTGTAYGNAGANNPDAGNEGAGGGGAGGAGQAGAGQSKGGDGGPGIQVNIDGKNYFWAGGGGGGGWEQEPGQGGKGGGGAGGYAHPSGTSGPYAVGGGGALSYGGISRSVVTGSCNGCGGAGGANTGGGGGGSGQADHGPCYTDIDHACGAAGGSGVVVMRIPCSRDTWCEDESGGSVEATGGETKTFSQNGKTYRVHTFKGSAIFTTSADITGAEVLMVAGGGSGGGRHGGGGGGGGVLYMTDVTIPAGNHGVEIGEGAPQVWGTGVVGKTGGATTFLGEVALGGGGGGTHPAAGDDHGTGGGSGGGGGHEVTNGGPGLQQNPAWHSGTGYGNAGGNSPHGSSNEGSGGGGAGSAGEQSSGGSKGGNGGAGKQFNIDGNNFYYAGGGGGGGWHNTPGSGGVGGGGAGGYADSGGGTTSAPGGGSALNTGGSSMTVGGSCNSCGGAGGANTGGGGGGSGQADHGPCYTSMEKACGAAGGSGILILRYEV